MASFLQQRTFFGDLQSVSRPACNGLCDSKGVDIVRDLVSVVRGDCVPYLGGAENVYALFSNNVDYLQVPEENSLSIMLVSRAGILGAGLFAIFMLAGKVVVRLCSI